MTFLQFQKELYYISEGFILKNSQKDLRRCEGFQKVLYSAGMSSGSSLWPKGKHEPKDAQGRFHQRNYNFKIR